jgi:site-specific recombinase XerC
VGEVKGVKMHGDYSLPLAAALIVVAAWLLLNLRRSKPSALSPSQAGSALARRGVEKRAADARRKIDATTAKLRGELGR